MLINAPTGTGKTLAALIAPIINFESDIETGKFTTIYISPLKSLIYDIKRNLQAPLQNTKLNIIVETRTGDTSSYNKQKQLKVPPNFLITTPESFALLMSYQNVEKFFLNIKYIIIDEIHNLIHTKRGDLLSLNLTRLSTFCPEAVKIALSATIGDTKKTLDYISAKENKICIEPKLQQKISLNLIKSTVPIPWSGHLATYAVKDIYAEVKSHQCTIIFVNTRAQSEFIFQSLWKINKYNLKIAVHHGSLDKKLRLKIEKEMYDGQLNCIVATSSLELGLDWGNVDLVIQVGAPKGINRIIQRIGRSNHNIQEASKAILVPTNKFEYLECLAAKEAINLRNLEIIPEKEGSLDVLAQHINGVACSKGFKSHDLFKVIKKSSPYKKLKKNTFNKVLEFVHNGGYVLKNYSAYSRLQKKNNIYSIANKNFIRRYRMNLGTIVEAEVLPVFWRNKKLGYIEENFINNLQPNDTFLFAGLILKFEKITIKGVQTSVSNKKEPKIPSYVGGTLPLSSFLANNVINLINNNNNYNFPKQIKDWLLIQNKVSSFPPKNGLLVESFTRAGYNYIVSYTFLGRNANQTIGLLIMKKLEEQNCRPIAFVATDYAIAVWSIKKFNDIKTLFSEKLLNKNLDDWIKNTSMLKKHFKKIAIVSGLIDRKLPGKIKTNKQLSFSTDLIYDVLEKHESNHILIKITKEEVLKELIDISLLKVFINKIKNNIIHNSLVRISPFAVPVVMEFYSTKISKDKLLKYKEDEIEEELINEAYKLS